MNFVLLMCRTKLIPFDGTHAANEGWRNTEFASKSIAKVAQVEITRFQCDLGQIPATISQAFEGRAQA